MIKLGARKKLFVFKIIRALVTTVCSLPIVVYGLICLINSLTQNKTSVNVSQSLLIYLSIPTLVSTIFFMVYEAFLIRRLRRETIYELYEIVTLTQLPKELPKVVYVYTAHGDMMKARVLQNSLQSYKNIEVWISEGSENQEIIESSRKFANENGFKFYFVGGKGSSNKAENLNSFLKNVKPTYDYLLVSDADEAFDFNFVEYAIKCFNWPKFRNLGYISPQQYVYNTNNLYSNIYANTDNNLFLNNARINFESYKTVPIFGAACLISKKLLDANNGLFPEGSLEDVFLESIAVRHGFSGLYLTISLCGQAYDKDIFAYLKRNMRIKNWIIYLAKKDKLYRYNEKHRIWFGDVLKPTFELFLRFIGLIALSIIIWLLVSYPKQLFANIFFIYSISTVVGIAILSFLLNFIKSSPKTTFNNFWFLFPFIKWIPDLAEIPYKAKNWFNGFVLNKKTVFGGSGHGSQNNKKHKNTKNIINVIIGLIITSCLIIAVTLSFYFSTGFKNINLNLLFIILIVFVGSIFIYFLLTLILYWMSLIKNNKKYNPDDFVYPLKKWELFEIKKQFIIDKQNNSKYDLSSLLQDTKKEK